MYKSYKKKTILITGASGFLGKKILKKLDKKKYNIIVITRKKIVGVKNIFVKDLFSLNIIQYKKFLKNVDIVLHLAWFVKHGEFYNSFENFNCLNGSIKLIEACRNKKIKKFIGIGTGTEYKPKAKSYNIKDKLDGQSIYAQSKISLYKYAKLRFKNTKTKFSWCRIFYLYGDGEPKNKLITSIRRSIKLKKKIKIFSSDKIIDFINVDDAADQLIRILESQGLVGEFNICSGKGQSIKKFIQNLIGKQQTSKFVKFLEDKPNNKSLLAKNYVGIKSL